MKQVKILARYELKDKKSHQLNGIVVYEVLSSNGSDKYHTVFHHGKASGCDCPSAYGCYHKTQLQAIEACRALALAGKAIYQAAVAQETAKAAAEAQRIVTGEAKAAASVSNFDAWWKMMQAGAQAATLVEINEHQQEQAAYLKQKEAAKAASPVVVSTQPIVSVSIACKGSLQSKHQQGFSLMR